jgi:hypothetical protein
MKKLCFIFLLLLLLGSGKTFSQNITLHPIPSYNVEVNGIATFEEDNSLTIISDGQKGRRIIKTGGTCHSKTQGTCSATVFFYSLDNSDKTGPYTLSEGEVITETIDERPWGVLVKTESGMSVSVWIDNILSVSEEYGLSVEKPVITYGKE